MRSFKGWARVACWTMVLSSSPAHARAQEEAWRVVGKTREDRLGVSVTWVDDVDGDGLLDALAGAPGEVSRNDSPGRVLLYSGSPLSQLPLREWPGDVDRDSFGACIASLGDVDGDGVFDFAAGAPTRMVAGVPVGAVFVYSGASTSLIRAYSSASTTGPIGSELASVGDLDQDGVRDLVYSDTLPNGPGVVVVSGRTGAQIRQHVDTVGSGFGAARGSIDCAGDVDADGIDDYIVGAPSDASFPPNVGVAYVYSGSTGALIWSLTNGSSVSGYGSIVSGAGDVDLDGHGDLIVADPSYNSDQGLVTVVSGSSGAVVYSIVGTVFPNTQVGRLVSETGDIDADGKNDLILADNDALNVISGATGTLISKFQFFPMPDALDATKDADADGSFDALVGIPQSLTARLEVGYLLGFPLSSSSSLLYVTGEAYDHPRLGAAIATLPDRDGDGFGEILVGEPRQVSTAPGVVSVRSGNDGHVLTTISPKSAAFGASVTEIPDLDGDGVADYAVGAPLYANGIVEVRSGRDDSIIPTIVSSYSGGAFGYSLASGVDAAGTIYLLVGDPEAYSGGSCVGAVWLFDLTHGTLVFTRNSSGHSACGWGSLVGHVGDVDGDGLPEWFVTDPDHPGYALVELLSGVDGSTLWYLDGALQRQPFGYHGVASIDDLDGDGIRDLLIGSVNGTTLEGRVTGYSGFDRTVIFEVKSSSPMIGPSVAAVGDVNGDGVSDFATGSPFDSPNGVPSAGSILLYSGATRGLLYRFTGDVDGGRLGEIIASSGTTDGARIDPDLIPDLLTSSPNFDTAVPDRGSVHVFRLDDLYLQIDPPVATVGSTVTVDTRGGPRSNLAGLYSLAVDGVPTNVFIAFGTFDFRGIWSVAGVIPSQISGHELTFQSFAIGFNGKIVDTTPQTLTVP